MRPTIPTKLEAGRIRTGPYGSDATYGLNGAFFVKQTPAGPTLRIIASDGSDDEAVSYGSWEHVSVSHAMRTPTWEEMAFVKDLFWGEDECVVQFHPPKSQYVNHHPHCLHLWKRRGTDFALPPSLLVGPKEEA